jgi:uncharacterized protein involved in outer membrane biogenesis
MFGLIGGLIRLVVKMSALAAGIGMIIAYANLSDVEGWKSDLSERMMNVAGRKLSFDGDIEFKVSFPPRIIARDVRIANAPWGSRKDMLKADTLIAEVDFLPLLVGDVAVPRLRLVGVDILVETSKSGETNWDDLNEFQTSSGGSPTGSNYPVMGTVLGSGGIGVSGGTITVANLATGALNSITLPKVVIDVASGVGNIGLPCN